MKHNHPGANAYGWFWRHCPTALQSPATERIGLQSPFARNKRNHLSRFVVVDDVTYNGRNTSRGVIGGGGNPLVPQKIDQLSSSYLLFAADFDAVLKDGDPLPATLSESEQNKIRDSYLSELWNTAEAEMRAVFENCVGFDQVTSAEGFARYLTKCQVETTMPFHDYWVETPDIPQFPLEAIKKLAMLFGLGLLACPVAWFLNTVFGASLDVEMAGWISLAALVLLVLTAIVAVMWINKLGNSAFPPPKYGDLPTVLKALYMQQTFAQFKIANQASSNEELHAAFGDFLEKRKPDDRSGPTQKPGYINSRNPDAVQT